MSFHSKMVIFMFSWLVGQVHPSEKYEFVNWDDDIPNFSGKIKLMATKPPTRYGFMKGKSYSHGWFGGHPFLGNLHIVRRVKSYEPRIETSGGTDSDSNWPLSFFENASHESTEFINHRGYIYIFNISNFL